MSLKYWYANTAVFFSTLASWPASVTEPSLGPSLGILCFTELLDTYLYFSLTSLRVCWFIGWLNAWKVLLVDRRLLLWNHPICYGPRSKILIIVSLITFVFPQYRARHGKSIYCTCTRCYQRCSTGIESRDTSQGMWGWPLAVVCIPDS